MHAEAGYWALLTEARPAAGVSGEGRAVGAGPTGLLEDWLRAGNRSVRDLFEMHPEALAAAMGRPLDSLAPVLALRARYGAAERLLAGLARAGVDLVTRWERRYPRALKEVLGDDAPPVLWFAGSLEALAQRPVAVLGSRVATPEALAFARAVAAGLAGRGRSVLGGLAGAVERAALEGVMAEPAGAFVAVLGQGIGRALPDLLRLQAQLRAGRLLAISAQHPEVFWQPQLEEARSRMLMALAERVVIAQTEEEGSIRKVARLALQDGRPLLVRASDGSGHAALVEQGATPVAWPATSAEALMDEVLGVPSGRAASGRATSPEPTVAGGEAPAAGTSRGRVRGQTGASHARVQRSTSRTPKPAGNGKGAGEERDLAEALARHLQRRHGVTGKGSLLRSFAVSEGALDRALATLIAGGRVAQRPHRTGAGYVAIRDGEVAKQDASFQLSLFGQEE